MTAARQNNPFAVGVLVSVLAGTIVYTAVQMRGEVDPPVTMTQVVQAASADTAPPSRGARPASRDPFYHPSLLQMANAPVDDGQRAAAPPNAGGPVLPFLPAVSVQPVPRPGGTGPAPGAVRAGPAPHQAASGSTAAVPQPAPDTIRVTAIVGGSVRSAVVEDAGPGPVVVRAGDRLGPARVVAVNAREIVLRGPRGISTVPLDSPARRSAGAGSSAEEDSDGVR